MPTIPYLHSGTCLTAIATQDPPPRVQFDVDKAERRRENFLKISTEQLSEFPRLTGSDDVPNFSLGSLFATNSEISSDTATEHGLEQRPDRVPTIRET